MKDEKEKINSFEDLNCWKACRELNRFIRCNIIPLILKYDFDLNGNILRACRSTTRNIAEEYGRYNYKDNRAFVIISRGSLFEIKDDLITLKEDEIINDSLFIESLQLCDNAKKLVNGYIKYLTEAYENSVNKNKSPNKN